MKWNSFIESILMSDSQFLSFRSFCLCELFDCDILNFNCFVCLKKKAGKTKLKISRKHIEKAGKCDFIEDLEKIEFAFNFDCICHGNKTHNDHAVTIESNFSIVRIAHLWRRTKEIQFSFTVAFWRIFAGRDVVAVDTQSRKNRKV